MDVRQQPGSDPVVDPRLAARAAAILSNLDDEQRAAATTPGPALILGVAGSGKSRVLAHRLAAMVASGRTPARRILALSRTPREAQLLRARAERLIGAPLHGAWIDTLHDICLRVLRAHATAVGRRASFTVLDESEARVLVRRAAAAAGVKEYSAGRLQELISLAKHRRVLPEGPAGEVYAIYERELTAANAFDAEDLVRHVLELLEPERQLAARFHRRFAHIVIDDFEDSTAPQRELVSRLVGPPGDGGGDVLAAADDDQTTAQTADAAAGGAQAAFLGTFPDARVVVLNRSYRASGRITYVAGRLAARAPQAMRRKGARVVSAAFADEGEEAKMVVRWLTHLAHHNDTPLRRTAILYRHAIQARPFEEALVREEVPYRVVYGPRFHDRREVKDVVAYLRLTIGGGDPAALARIANVPRRGIGPASVATIGKLSRLHKIGMAEAALRAASLPRVTAARAGALADLGRLLTDLAEATRDHTCAELIDYVVERSGYGQLLGELSRSEEETRREGIDELRGLARAIPGAANEALPALLARVAPATSGDEGGARKLHPSDTDSVQLLTFADAKGHDFDIVFLTGFEEGLLPGARAIRQGGEAIDAERHLAYIGVTRARNRLIITRALTRTIFGQSRPGEPSRFLGEMGRRIRRFRLGSARPKATASTLPAPGVAPPLVPAMVKEGLRVVHPRYGGGIVTRLEPKPGGDAGFAWVRFDDATEKRLSLAFARLQAPAEPR